MRRAARSARAALTALAAMALAGCEATHVLYVHDTVFGLDLAPVAEDSARFTFGFDRQVFSIVPCFEEVTPGPPGADGSAAGKPTRSLEAASVAAFSRVVADGISDVTFHHLVATGAPAQDIAIDPVLLKQLRESIVDRREPAKEDER